jgi:hypothetical protein
LELPQLEGTALYVVLYILMRNGLVVCCDACDVDLGADGVLISFVNQGQRPGSAKSLRELLNEIFVRPLVSNTYRKYCHRVVSGLGKMLP